MKLSMILGLSLASVTMAAVNGTRPSAANSTIAKAPVVMQDYITGYEKQELLATLPNVTSAEVVEVEDVNVVNVNNGTNNVLRQQHQQHYWQPATTATGANQGAGLVNGRPVGAFNGTNSTSGALPPQGPRANAAVGIKPVFGDALLGAFVAAMVYMIQ
ncbi:hypothetical protein BZA77DRAFT_304377, partial [Pyronema omphalodes]